MQKLETQLVPTVLMAGIYGSGEMAERVRAHDWSRTAMGPIRQWPEVLRTTVNTLLSSRQPMFLWWGEELVQFYNDAYRKSLGADKHPLALGQRGNECWPEIWPVVGPLIDKVMRNGDSYWSEDQLIPILRDGRMVDVYWTYSYSPVWHADGAIGGTLVVCSETTGRVLTESSGRAERGRLLGILQQAPAFFALLQGPDHVFTMTNALYQRLVNNRDVLGKSVHVALPEAAEQGYIEILDRVYKGQPYAGSGARYDAYVGEGLPADEHYIDFVYQPLRESDGSVSGIIVMGVDVTDKRKAQDALIHAEKLATVGRLASSIAHEINNPLEAVTNLLYLVRIMDCSETVNEYLDAADRELRRVAVITNQTLRFHKQGPTPMEVQGEDLIESVLTLHHGRINHSKFSVERRYRSSAAVSCFEGEIRQVVNNLVGNALDAMDACGGRLLLRKRGGTDHETGRKGMIITVADNGPGMPPSVAERAFQPFFTTKGSQGTGQGLWISREIVSRHAGKILLRTSQKPKRTGTTISVFLPFERTPGLAALA
jgi:signal transduction histidine kinase